MKILFLTSDFLPNIGGMATHAHELARALVRNGNEVHLVNPVYGSGKRRIEEIDGIIVHRLYFPLKVPKLKHMLYILGVRKYLIKLLAKEGFDVLHFHDLTPNCWTTKFFVSKLPVVWTNHTSNYLEYYETTKGRKRIRKYLGHINAVIGPSKELAEKSEAIGLPPEAIFYIPNGVDAKKFSPGVQFGNLPERCGIDPSRPVVICPRRLEPKNGVEYFIRSVPRVLEKFPEAQFLIVGGGFPEERERFEKMLTEWGCRRSVVFTGNVPNTDMPAYYSMADIAVLPSLMEATSISGLEAMASGLPLVGTRVGGIPEIVIDGETGILVEPRNHEALAEAILNLFADLEFREQLGRNARHRVETTFSWIRIAGQTVDVYEYAITRWKQG